jgi:GH15 family glucan-1,4-alpha-glucosidase
MAWVALDRAIKAAEEFSLRAPLARWRALRARIHADVCRKAYDTSRKSFVQYYGSDEVDASLLLMSLVGFLPPTDERVRNTLAVIERELVADGLVARYRTRPSVDGLPPGEGFFLPCSFWLADALSLAGRQAEAVALFSRLLALRNDVGLIAEEYDPIRRRQLGNFPQALTHVGIINTARNLSRAGGPSEHRGRGMRDPPPGVAELRVRRGRPARKQK